MGTKVVQWEYGGPGPSQHPLSHLGLTSKPSQKEVIIGVGQGRQHVLDIFSELGGRGTVAKVGFSHGALVSRHKMILMASSLSTPLALLHEV